MGRVVAHDFYEDDWQEHNQFGWDTTPAGLWDDVTRGEGWDDDYGKMLFEMVFVDPIDADNRAIAYNTLVEWFHDEYDLDFEDVFDWEGWREWYG
jgi:hypothetical protein